MRRRTDLLTVRGEPPVGVNVTLSDTTTVRRRFKVRSLLPVATIVAVNVERPRDDSRTVFTPDPTRTIFPASGTLIWRVSEPDLRMTSVPKENEFDGGTGFFGAGGGGTGVAVTAVCPLLATYPALPP